MMGHLTLSRIHLGYTARAVCRKKPTESVSPALCHVDSRAILSARTSLPTRIPHERFRVPRSVQRWQRNGASASVNGTAVTGSTEEVSTNGAAAVEGMDALPFYEPQYELLAAAKVIPHPAKREKGGEDAYLISNTGAGVLFVADGVGGWAESGVDPALYSRELAQRIEEAVDAAQVQEDLEPKSVLSQAFCNVTAEGAATAVLAVFDGEQSMLQIANLGDSGLIVVRRGEVIFRTRSQQHFFDCPYQLGSESGDLPEDADVYKVALTEGDTVILASDGLFDNVFDKDIASVIKVFGGPEPMAVQRCATALAALASRHSMDEEYMSPYSLEAIEQGKDVPVWEKMMGKKRCGGKMDDITVVVAQVVPASLDAVEDEPAAVPVAA